MSAAPATNDVPFRLLAEASVEFIGLCDVELRPFYMNPAGWRLVGLPSMEAACAVTVQDYFFPEDRPFISGEFFPRVLRDGSAEVEIRFRHFVTGAAIWMHYKVFALRGADGATVGYATVSRDVSERKRAEDALRESEERLTLFIEHAPASIAMLDTGLRYIAASKRWREDYELGQRDLRGVCHYDVFPEIPERWREAHRRCLAGAVEHADEDPFRRADGSIQWLRWEIHPWHTAAGAVGGIVMFTEDITERKRAEEERGRHEAELWHAQKLESLGVLAGGIAHDFNNLLTGILGYSDLALRALPADSPARAHLERAIDGGRRAAELTAQMLAYSGKGRFVVELIDLSLLVEEMMRLLEVSISKKCGVRYALAGGLPAAEVDVSQIQQVVMNLVINASEAIGDQPGTLVVNTGVLDCDARLATELGEPALRPGPYVYLEVTDTGCGMSEDTRSRIFEPFFTTKFTGRGLGLSAVQGIVRGHRGAIRIRSELGAGTTVTVLLPASARPAGVQRREPRLDQEWRGGGTVLVIDDEEPVREVARQMLESMGFSVLTACDGREGLEIFRRDARRIELVLLDLTMPTLDGAETFRQMRRIRPDVRAILSSGYSEQTATNRFASEGLAAFIQKPYRYQQLLDVVRAALRRSDDPGTGR